MTTASDVPMNASAGASAGAPADAAFDAPPDARASGGEAALESGRGSTQWIVCASAVALLAIFGGIVIGPAGLTWWRVPLALLDHLPLISIDSGVTDSQWNILWEIRMPRVVLGGMVGAMLSVGGASYQGVFRNPLVDPYQLGAAAGAGLGATLMIATFRGAGADWPIDPVPAVAFVCAIAAVAVTYFVGAAFGGLRSTATLVLSGVAMVSLLTAAQTFLLQRNSEVIRDVYTWILGRLNTADWEDVKLVAPYVAVACVILFLHRRHLDALRVGDDEATTLGIPVARVRLIVVVAATLGTAAVVSVSGLIGFVGIVVPHVVRLVAGSSYRRVLPLSALFGAAFLIVCDIPARMLTAPSELPIGVITAFVGAPFFILLLRTRNLTR